MTAKEARRLERGEASEKVMRPEVSSTLDAYIDLHRHAGIRAKLVEDNRASIQRTKRRGTLTYDSDRKNVWYLVRERLKRMQEIRCKSTL